MADIVNITRTYRFADGIPFLNSQLDSELSNIVDRINKNISVITQNVIVVNICPEPGVGVNATYLTGSDVPLNICTVNIGQGEWEISGMAAIDPTGGTTLTSFSAGKTTTVNPVIPGGYVPGVTGQSDVGIASSSHRTYITLPPYIFRGASLGPATVYLQVSANYTGNDPYVFGHLFAKRMNT